MTPTKIYTIGHSTHTIQEFTAILRAFAVALVADVRTIPKSRHNPQFNSAELAASLAAYDIHYVHLESLGGLRHTSKVSINTAWHNTSFRGYADYMQTPEFAAGMDQLIAAAARQPTAIMCAEAVPWRCHRSLIGDALLARNIAAEDIYDATHSKPHTLTPFAQVRGLEITYPAPDQSGR